MEQLQTGAKVVGQKQARRVLKDGLGALCYVAQDAEERVTQPIVSLCAELGVPVRHVETMRLLGEACGIHIGASVAVILRSAEPSGT